MIFPNALKLISQFTAISNSRGCFFVLRSFFGYRDSAIVDRFIIFCLRLVLGLLLRLGIAHAVFGIVTILVFGIPVFGVFYISRLT